MRILTISEVSKLLGLGPQSVRERDPDLVPWRDVSGDRRYAEVVVRGYAARLAVTRAARASHAAAVQRAQAELEAAQAAERAWRASGIADAAGAYGAAVEACRPALMAEERAAADLCRCQAVIDKGGVVPMDVVRTMLAEVEWLREARVAAERAVAVAEARLGEIVGP